MGRGLSSRITERRFGLPLGACGVRVDCQNQDYQDSMIIEIICPILSVWRTVSNPDNPIISQILMQTK